MVRGISRRLTAGVALAGLLTALAQGRSAAPPAAAAGIDAGRIGLALKPLIGGLRAPLFVTNARDGSGRIYVVEQGGTIRVVSGGRLSSSPFLDIGALTAAGGERGLLGLAFHPAYARNGRLFVDYTDRNGDTVIAEYRRAIGGATADPGSARVLLRIAQPFPNHNGGDVAFGPDGYLYIGMGDGGSGGDPYGNGQRLDTLLGKLLRIDVSRTSGAAPYGIPADNPFRSRAGARPEIWAYGLRNPWRFSFDPARKWLWIGDVGQNRIEEIDRARIGAAGLNYGWNTTEGGSCYKPGSGCAKAGLTLPIVDYTHDAGCSVTGGYAYRGAAFAALRNVYLYADYCSGTIWGLRADGPASQQATVLLQTHRAITSFGEDERGELYVTDGNAGAVLRVTAG